MMPPPLAPPAPRPTSPVASDAGPSTKGDRDPSSPPADFAALLALLAGMSPAAPSSSVGACASSSGQASGAPQDGPADTEPFPGSLEATVAALVHQTSGLGPGFTTPAHPALALPPVVDPTTAQAQPGVAVAAGPSDSRSLDNADPSAPMVATGTGSPVAVPAPTNRSEERSPVSVLARGDGGNGSGSPVSVLAHSRDADRPGTAGSAAAPIAAVDADPSAALPPNDAAAPAAASTQTAAGPSRRPSGTLGELQAPAPPAVGPPAARPAEAVAAPADTAPAATPEAVADQIVSAVVPLHGRGDGRHEVTLELRPDDLGAIRVEVSVEHQTVHLTLHAAEPATGRLLSAALPDLRSALADAGLTAGRIGVGPGGGSGAGQRRPAAPVRSPHRTRSAGDRERNSPVRTVHPAIAGRLDLFL